MPVTTQLRIYTIRPGETGLWAQAKSTTGYALRWQMGYTLPDAWIVILKSTLPGS